MQFLSPIYLFGLLAVAAPILIHLIRRRKVTVVQWAAHRFLVAVTKKLQKRKRIQDLILLLLRCLLFVLLALLFARPFLERGTDVMVEEAGTLVVLVDASASMDYRNGVRSRFDVARGQVEAALSGLPGGTSVALILFADQAYPVVSPPTLEHNVVLQELDRQTTRPGRSNLTAGMAASLEVLSERGSGSILLITDGQATVWQATAQLADLMQEAEAQGVRLKLVNVAEGQDASNLGITAFDAVNAKPIAGQPVRLQVVVKNGGESPSQKARLVLEQAVGFPVEEAWVPSLQPGEATQIAMQITFADAGWQCLTVRLPGDHLATDNSRSIGLSVTPGLKVGLVEGPRNRALTVPPGFFLSAAAVPVSGMEVRNFPIQLARLSSGELNRERLKEFRVILLAGVATLSGQQVEALSGFVETGGGLWIAPPSDADAAQQFIQSVPLNTLFPTGELAYVEGRSGLPAAGPYDHPITGYWNESGAGSLNGFFSDRYLGLTAGEGVQTVLPLNNGSPLFVTQTRGAGRVFFSALPLDGAWSELPLSPQFVPLVQRSLQWLSGAVDAPVALTPGEGWRVRVPAIHVGRPFYVRTPLSTDVSQLAGKVEFQSGQAIIAYTDTSSLGRYQIYLNPEGGPVGSFGVNLPPEESDLRRVSADALADVSVDGSGIDSEKSDLRSGAGGWLSSLPEPWMLLVFLIMLTGAVELYLAQRFSRTA